MSNYNEKGCKHTDCVYRLSTTGQCDYFTVMGTTRTFLHKGENVDINNPCREYKTGKTNHIWNLQKINPGGGT